MNELHVMEEDDFHWNLNRSILEMNGLVDDFSGFGIPYPDNKPIVFSELMHECEYAPMALNRAKAPGTHENNPFSHLFYFASKDETPQQLKYLQDYNWLCVPDDTLPGPRNDLMDDVE